ncbi:MAG: tetratricopeptide repeat protein [Verrucomicrobia bacterium]|nr:tetratricopeptide repeat protein [Verrucomicrobiota bacterium]MCH8528899.1 tetratricopeptide repeat protein [Kiritimatiellia bacterium]
MDTCRKSIFNSFAALAILALTAVFSGGCASLRAARGGTDPLTAAERLNLGVTYEQEGELKLALREYRRAERGSMKSAALTYQGNIFAAAGDTPEAERLYRAALKNDPDYPGALNNLAWLLADGNGSLDEAEALIRRALSLEPLPREPYEDTLRSIQAKRAE